MPSHCGLGEAAQRESCFAKCISSLRSSPGGNGGLVAQAYRCVRPRPRPRHTQAAFTLMLTLVTTFLRQGSSKFSTAPSA